MAKLKRVHIIGGAVGIALLLVAGVYFGMIKGVNEQIEQTVQQIGTAMGGIQGGGAGTAAESKEQVEEAFKTAEAKAKEELATANADFAVAQVKLREYRQRYKNIMFRKNVGEVDDVYPQLDREFRDLLVRDFQQFIEDHDCRLTSPLNIGQAPMPPIPFPSAVLFPIPYSGGGGGGGMGMDMMGGGMMGGAMMGGGFPGGDMGGGSGGPIAVSVRGRYSAIATLLKQLPNFSRLNVVGPVTFRNAAPPSDMVDASFPITFYLIADGPPDVVKEALSRAGQQQQAGAMGGMGMGMGGDMSGMMGGGMGGPPGMMGGGMAPGMTPGMMDPAGGATGGMAPTSGS